MSWTDPHLPFLYTQSLFSLPADQTITALGAVMSPQPNIRAIPDATRKICSNMLGSQLLREDGVLGLMSAMFGDSSSAEGVYSF